MNSLWNLALLWAYRDPRLDGIASGFRSRQTTANSGAAVSLMLVFGGLIVAFWLLARWTDRLERQKTKNSPWGLFFSLAKAHRLKWSERWFLWRLARRQRLADPSRIFLEPRWLDPAQAGVGQAAQTALLESLGRRLFAELYEDASPYSEGSPTSGSSQTKPGTAPTSSIPLFPAPLRPGLDLPPWNPSSSGESSATVER